MLEPEDGVLRHNMVVLSLSLYTSRMNNNETVFLRRASSHSRRQQKLALLGHENMAVG